MTYSGKTKQVGSLAGAAHLLKDNAGVLRWAQREQKSRVEQKGKSSFDSDLLFLLLFVLSLFYFCPLDSLVFLKFFSFSFLRRLFLRSLTALLPSFLLYLLPSFPLIHRPYLIAYCWTLFSSISHSISSLPYFLTLLLLYMSYFLIPTFFLFLLPFFPLIHFTAFLSLFSLPFSFQSSLFFSVFLSLFFLHK